MTAALASVLKVATTSVTDQEGAIVFVSDPEGAAVPVFISFSTFPHLSVI